MLRSSKQSEPTRSKSKSWTLRCSRTTFKESQTKLPTNPTSKYMAASNSPWRRWWWISIWAELPNFLNTNTRTPTTSTEATHMQTSTPITWAWTRIKTPMLAVTTTPMVMDPAFTGHLTRCMVAMAGSPSIRAICSRLHLNIRRTQLLNSTTNRFLSLIRMVMGRVIMDRLTTKLSPKAISRRRKKSAIVTVQAMTRATRTTVRKPKSTERMQWWTTARFSTLRKVFTPSIPVCKIRNPPQLTKA